MSSSGAVGWSTPRAWRRRTSHPGRQELAIASQDLLPPASEYLNASGSTRCPGWWTSTTMSTWIATAPSRGGGLWRGHHSDQLYLARPEMDVPSSLDHWSRFGESASIVDFSLHMGLMDTPDPWVERPAGRPRGDLLQADDGLQAPGTDGERRVHVGRHGADSPGGGVATVHCENGGRQPLPGRKDDRAGISLRWTTPAPAPHGGGGGHRSRHRPRGHDRLPPVVVHVTTARGVELVAQAQAAGQPVWAEACRHLPAADGGGAREARAPGEGRPSPAHRGGHPGPVGGHRPGIISGGAQRPRLLQPGR